MMLTSMMLTMTIMFMFISHPLSMGMILLIQTLLISMWTGFMSMNFWYSYILFIVMVGGMLILFIYMTSVASNEKFSFSKINMLITMTMSLIIIITMMTDNIYNVMNSMNSDLLMYKNLISFKLSLNKFIMYPMMMMSLTLIIYLLITLIAVSKITNIQSGPLRKYN
uniref:NADH dehydrogenase subunit 6 n=1 Tax=Medeopteryx maehongsonensis TaxID=2971077 RepID=UPI002A837B36|nr:NADH dehydrogenase subunit 6 [Medeopteryx maehongsonensis]WOR80703.1 NADH dehydrogenase subunit 6 [Medeopteryx maehongsonensis]